MMTGTITICIGALLAALLLRAAWGDWRARDIPNWLTGAIALLALSWWWATGVDLWPDAAFRIGGAVILFGLCAIAFALRMMGGGDVKMLAALALWFAPPALLRLIFVMSLVGCVLTLGFYIAYRRQIYRAKAVGGDPATVLPPEVPYGIAIAAAGLWELANVILTNLAE